MFQKVIGDDLTFRREWTHEDEDIYYIRGDKTTKAKLENALNL